MAPETGIGFGNLLYLLFDAYRHQQRGRDYRVLAHPWMNDWLSAAPELAGLSVKPDQVRFADRREQWAFRLAASF